MTADQAAQQEQMLGVFEELYRDVTGSIRDVRADDRLSEDLAIDSLIAVELLSQLEDRYEITLLQSSEIQRVHTVNELVTLIAQLA
jgi:acyl carrier protein